MDEKTLHTLEFPKVLERLAEYTAFPASRQKALALRPTDDLAEALRRQAETSEAVRLLATHPSLTIGGARDVRPQVDLALHGGVLTPTELLDVRSTLIAGRDLARLFDRLKVQYPYLSEMAAQLPQPPGLIEAIGRAISDRGEVLDTASPKLAAIRRDLHIVHDRLLSKMQHMLNDPKINPFLQEALITQRDGRYVLPLRSEFKGRIHAIVHDQSASGATLFVEPLAVVELNNQYRELQLAERDEERRILAELSQQIALHAQEILQMVEVIADLDLALARAKYSLDLRASEPDLRSFPHQPKTLPSGITLPGSIIRLYEARHPLLDPQTVVPIDAELDEQTFAVVITGPNTGGKTVTLKTVGLLALMAQSGLHIPAQSGSTLTVFGNVFADIGDEQSIEQSLSTFSGHITNIIRILKQADARSLVLLDELGAGTDPQEGAALAQAILSHLLERGITTLVATHYPELKAFAHAKPGVVNASVEFDLETLRPTYHLIIGLPGRSNALLIAERLGLPADIIETARAGINPADLQAEDLLEEIHRQRALAHQARQEAEKARQDAEKRLAELNKHLEDIQDEREKILEEARRAAAAQVEELQAEVRRLRSELARARQPLQPLQAIQQEIKALAEQVEQPIERLKPERVGLPLRRELQVGDRVRLRTLNTQGIVIALEEEEAEVQVGLLRVRARVSELEPLAAATAEPPSVARPSRRAVETPITSPLPASPGMELDLRGLRADEALDALERYLDAAYLAGLPFVRIIHGKGTGKLRQAVRQALMDHPYVRSFEPGSESEGGAGVTVVKLQKE